MLWPDDGGTSSRRESGRFDAAAAVDVLLDDETLASATVVGRVDSIQVWFWLTISAAASAAAIACRSDSPGMRRMAPRFSALTLSR